MIQHSTARRFYAPARRFARSQLRAIFWNLHHRGQFQPGFLLNQAEKLRWNKAQGTLLGRGAINAFVRIKEPLLHVVGEAKQATQDVVELGSKRIAAVAKQAMGRKIWNIRRNVQQTHLSGQTDERLKRILRVPARHFGTDFGGDFWKRGKPTDVMPPASLNPFKSAYDTRRVRRLSKLHSELMKSLPRRTSVEDKFVNVPGFRRHSITGVPVASLPMKIPAGSPVLIRRKAQVPLAHKIHSSLFEFNPALARIQGAKAHKVKTSVFERQMLHKARKGS